jgi:hypothetical protein
MRARTWDKEPALTTEQSGSSESGGVTIGLKPTLRFTSYSYILTSYIRAGY